MTIPLIDWPAAPSWAACHIFQPWGEGYWGEFKPELGTLFHNRGRWWFKLSTKHQASGHDLPLGYDYRTTLEERPAVSKRPTIVCLCGSTRFSEAFRKANLEQTLAGKIVLTIGCDLRSDAEIFGHMSLKEITLIKEALDDLHLRKIDLADEVLILNVGNYVGESTARELAYAREQGKGIRFLEYPYKDAEGNYVQKQGEVT